VAKDTSQVGLRLPNDVLKKLQREGEGVSEAIRRRLDLTFELDKYANEDRALMEAVLHLSRQVRLHTGIAWNQNNSVRMALVAAIESYAASAMIGDASEWANDIDGMHPEELAEAGFKDKTDPLYLGGQLGRAYIRLLKETAEEDDGTQAR
jgi:hypothetical protein